MSNSEQTMLQQLKNPFDTRFVKWRIGATNKDKTKGIALAYIDSREVMKRLDEVCGIGGWQAKYVPVENGFICELSIKMPDGSWVTKSNAAGYTQVEPIKGGASDAFKRAASSWGVGRYLYYLPNTWVAIKAVGKSYALDIDNEMLAEALPDWAKPGKVEKWEDVAEMEADTTSGADVTDEIPATAQDEAVLEEIRSIKTTAELKQLLTILTAEQLKNYISEIEAKKKELTNATA